MDTASRQVSIRVSYLYRQLLDQADQLLANCADGLLEDPKRDQYLRDAGHLQTDAGLLAHAIARFGDLDILHTDLDPLEEEIRNCSCAGTNPWFRALHVIRQKRERIQEIRTLLRNDKDGKLVPSPTGQVTGGAWTGERIKDLAAHLDQMPGNRRIVILCRVSEHQLRLALQHCATKPLLKFSYYRLTTGTDWVSEYRRFAFGREPS